ncbi:MAG: hypothetical protein M0C28_15885, partial [Candidatus Moduliflexus flocculans]|nr:hypothetical protein [Candidatus Moduliflexus flocculans]
HTSFSYVLLRLNRRLQTESTAPLDLPANFDENTGKISYQVILPPNSEKKAHIKIQPLFNYRAHIDGAIDVNPPTSFDEALTIIQMPKDGICKIKIDGDVLNLQKTIDKSIEDLNMLVNYINIDGKTYSYVGAGLQDTPATIWQGRHNNSFRSV